MTDYQAMYFKLAAKTADAIKTLDKISCELKFAQLAAEEMYLAFGDEEDETEQGK